MNNIPKFAKSFFQDFAKSAVFSNAQKQTNQVNPKFSDKAASEHLSSISEEDMTDAKTLPIIDRLTSQRTSDLMEGQKKSFLPMKRSESMFDWQQLIGKGEYLGHGDSVGFTKINRKKTDTPFHQSNSSPEFRYTTAKNRSNPKTSNEFSTPLYQALPQPINPDLANIISKTKFKPSNNK